jgi:hypothetical protein
MTECPHCGVALPATVDAFCPECREPLDERPASLAALVERGPAVVTRTGLPKVGASLMVLGGLVLFLGLFALFLGSPGAAVVRFLLGAMLLGAGASAMLAHSRRQTANRESTHPPAQ